MASNAKGKKPIEEEHVKSGKLPVRRGNCINSTQGFVIRDEPSSSSGSDDQRVPVWDLSGGYHSAGIIPAEPGVTNKSYDLIYLYL